MDNFNKEAWELEFPGVEGSIQSRKILVDLAHKFYRSGMTPKQWVAFIESKQMFLYFVDIAGGSGILKHIALFVWFPMR